MSKKTAFWSIWSVYSVFMIGFFFVIGELEQVDAGKAIILTSILIISAIPIYYWVKKNDDFF
ncbi:hypothetical protein GCM10009092_27570 [Bowmanella denitrificans]|uniref:Uncharacterized protein n=1 Tax=Bowmanella denitrificans TaxID=366582 RepID=A0ABN0XDT5_9ALTE